MREMKKRAGLSGTTFAQAKAGAGFTLIEMMVALTIVGLLASFVVGNVIKSQKRGMDGRRQGDIKTIQTAFEQYYVVNNVYPINATEAAAAFPNNIFPRDPRNAGTFVYTATYNATGTIYCVCALLESTPGNATSAGASGVCTYGVGNYFCMNNLQ